MINLEVNGRVYGNFTRITATRSYIEVPADFSFTATTDPQDLTYFPIQKGDKCRVLVNDKAFITGHIDVVSIDHSQGRHEISVEGRSMVSDLVDSTMDGRYEINGPIGMLEALKRVVALSGLEIDVLNNVDDIPDFTINEKLSGDLGSPVWDFMTDIALKKNVLITENGDGQIVLIRGGGKKIHDSVIKKQFGEDNNITASRSVRSDRTRYNKYKVLSQSDSSALAGGLFGTDEHTATASISGSVTDDDIRVTRVKCFVSEKSGGQTDCYNRAVWQSNMSRSKGFSYSCDAPEFISNEGTVFEPGQVLHVLDEYQMVDSDLIIDTVSLEYDMTGGSKLTREFLRADSFTLIANEPKAPSKKKGNNTDWGIFS